MNKADVLGTQIDLIRLDEVLVALQEIIARDERAIITHVNMHGVNIAYEQAWFRHFLNNAQLNTCDGMGVKLGARLLGIDIPERFTLADWMWRLAGLADRQGFSIFLLGNPPGVPERAADRLHERFPGLCIAGVQHGHFEHTTGHPENEAAIQKINAARPDILMVGFGMPEQERWLAENWSRLDANVAITCGALFEYLAGELKRGPHWMTENYMEWLARMLISPRRYLGRYLRDNPVFLYRLVKHRLPSNGLK